MADLEKTLHFISRDEEERVTREYAQRLGLPYINLADYTFPPDVFGLIPQDDAGKYRLVAFLREGNSVRLASPSPEDKGTVGFLTELTKRHPEIGFSLVACSETSFRYALSLYKTLVPKGAADARVAVEEEQKSLSVVVKGLADLKERVAKASATEILDLLFAGALSLDASDVHLEPQQEKLVVRFRIDGVLQNVVELPTTVHKALVSRIKFLAKMKLDVTGLPQDGRFEVMIGKEATALDIRVATLPTPFGEAVEMRLLTQKRKTIDLSLLGFSKEVLDKIEVAIKKPHGLILNTGPTGSGKTTTLYGILQKLNKPGVKIISIEDPIEYRIPGVDQSQIDPPKGYTYAVALRSALRQDPDIIMIGEIRDPEVAATALQAALTGHLVLSTLHTNSASAAIPRLLEMGIAPYLLAGSINLIIAQRLVRKIHKECEGKGCDIDNRTGFKGRVAIGEALVPTPEFNQLIVKKASVAEFEEAAKKTGMTTMLEDGKGKVAQGTTTQSEISRVTQE
jgi:type IV pilus assembly protein PilB